MNHVWNPEAGTGHVQYSFGRHHGGHRRMAYPTMHGYGQNEAAGVSGLLGRTIGVLIISLPVLQGLAFWQLASEKRVNRVVGYSAAIGSFGLGLFTTLPALRVLFSKEE